MTDECHLADPFLARVGVKQSVNFGVGAFANLWALLVPYVFNFDPKYSGTCFFCAPKMCAGTEQLLPLNCFVQVFFHSCLGPRSF